MSMGLKCPRLLAVVIFNDACPFSEFQDFIIFEDNIGVFR